MIKIKAVDEQNILDVCELTTNQDGICTTMDGHFCCNAISIAEAKYDSEMHPNAIYNGNVLIGFFMYKRTENQAEKATICRFMIDDRFKNKGFEEKSYTPDVQVDEINIDVEDREIEVSLSEDEQVHIKYYENSKEYYDISVSDENVLTMTSADSKEWTDYIGGKPSAENRKILLQIPNALIDTLTLSATNENIALSALEVEDSISVSANGGDIAFGNLNVGSALNLNVKNGDIAGTITGSYDDFAIKSEIKKGESNLPDNKDGGEKTLNVSGNNGDVKIEFVNE